ncbi:MAG TPA: hypothetical protein VN650_01230 [Gemmatimonadaceae bacterium]|nr:hypothetical protein [Gemmatimonadaceae bacterium]
MFPALLVVTFAVALVVSAIVAFIFSGSIRRILDRVVAPECTAR